MLVKKWIYISATVVILIIIAGFFAFANPIKKAVLKVDYGDVQVDNGNGYQPVTGTLELKENAKVKTGQGSAILILFESSITIIDPDTEISVEDLVRESPKVKQDKGTTWNKFTALSGMKSFETEMPTAVAVARATGYELSLQAILVADGTVEVKADGTAVSVLAGNALVKEATWIQRPLTDEEKAGLLARLKKSVEVLKQLRLEVIEDHKVIYAAAKKAARFSDEQRDKYFADADAGLRDVEGDYEKSPVKNEWTRQIADISLVIQGENSLINEFGSYA